LTILITPQKQVAQLPPRNRTTCYVSKSVLRYTSYRSYNVSNSKSDIQGHWQWCHSI